MDLTAPTNFIDAFVILVAAAVAILTAIANQPGWTASRKRLTAGIFAAILGTLYAIATGRIPLVPDQTVQAIVAVVIVIATVYAFSQAIYQGFKGSLSWLENKTALGTAPVKGDERGDGEA